jgi:hypothetical protein
MRVLVHVHSESELQRVTDLMHDKGVPTYSRRAVPRSADRWVVFVCLNDQLKDAAQLLANPGHIPSYSVDVARFERAAYSRNMDVIGGWATLTAVAVALLFALIVYLQIRYGR